MLRDVVNTCNDSESLRLDDIHDWTEKAAAAGWRVKDLAELCGVTTRGLELWFKRKYGCTVKDWLAQEWQRHAKDMLIEQRRVSHAAEKAGCAHPQHFARRFKRLCGVTPSAFIASCGGGGRIGALRILVGQSVLPFVLSSCCI
jgi:AraC-like DNA-binding protein